MGKEFDDRDLMELIHLAAYLENLAKRGKFPKARFNRYSKTLERLVRELADVYGEDATLER